MLAEKRYIGGLRS